MMRGSQQETVWFAKSAGVSFFEETVKYALPVSRADRRKTVEGKRDEGEHTDDHRRELDHPLVHFIHRVAFLVCLCILAAPQKQQSATVFLTVSARHGPVATEQIVYGGCGGRHLETCE